MLINFVISTRTPCVLITDLVLGNSGFGNLVKLLNLPWQLNVIIIFYIFACKATKLKFHQVLFALVSLLDWCSNSQEARSSYTPYPILKK